MPGSRVGGWYKKTGAKTVYWYPDDVANHPDAAAHFDVPNAADAEMKKLAGGALKGADYNTVKAVIGSDRAHWRDHLAHMRRNAAGVAPAKVQVLGDHEGKARFDHVDDVDAHNWGAKKASMGDATWNKTPYGHNFQSVDSLNFKYRVLAGAKAGTYRVTRADVSSGNHSEVDNVPPHVLQAMMSRWKHVPGKGPTQWTPHQAASNDGPWKGEERVFKDGADAAHAAPLFEKMDVASAKTKLVALKAAAAPFVNSPNPQVAAKAQATVAAVSQAIATHDELTGKQVALQKKFDADLLAHRKAAGKPIPRDEVYEFQKKWFIDNKAALVDCSATKLKWDSDQYNASTYINSWSTDASLATPGVKTPQELEDAWAQSEAAHASSGDGPMTRGPDGALYALGWDHGVPGLDEKRVADYAKAYADLYKKNGFVANGSSSVATTQDEKDVEQAILMITAGNVASVHYPEVCFNAALVSSSKFGGGGGSGGVSLGASVEDFKRAHAILTVLATRRPPAVALPKNVLYRNVALSKETFAGLHAGKIMQMNGGASFANHDAAEWGKKHLSYKHPVHVVYRIDNPKAGMPLKHLSGFPNEDETSVSGSLAIKKIERLSDGRMCVHVRHLEPGELQEAGLHKAASGRRGGLDDSPALSVLDHRANALLWYDEAMHAMAVRREREDEGREDEDHEKVNENEEVNENTREVAKGSFVDEATKQRSADRADMMPGKRLADPTDRLPALDARPSPRAVRALLAEWRLRVPSSTRAAKVRLAVARGNYGEAKRLMELDMSTKIEKSGGGRALTPAEIEQQKSGSLDDTLSSASEWADSVNKGASGSGLDGAWLTASLREAIRDHLRWNDAAAKARTDEQIAQTVADALIARVLGWKESTGGDRVERILKVEGETAVYDRALKLVPQIRAELGGVAEASALVNGGIALTVKRLEVPSA